MTALVPPKPWPDGARNNREAALYTARTPEQVEAAMRLLPEADEPYDAREWQIAYNARAEQWEAERGFVYSTCQWCCERTVYRGTCLRCQVVKNATGDPFRCNSDFRARPCTPLGCARWLWSRTGWKVTAFRCWLGALILPYDLDDR